MNISVISNLSDDVNTVAEILDAGYSEDPPNYSERKVIRDAIWDFHNIEAPYLIFLDSPFMQRLRFISQTAFTSLTYPCAQHSRLEHSLGVFNVTEKMLSALEENSGGKIEEPYRTETKLASLIHDIGHGPFSHSSETIYSRDSVFSELGDRYSNAAASEILAFCLIHSEPVQALLDQFIDHKKTPSDISPERIGDMIIGNEDGLPSDYEFLRFIINGPFDADKIDYINRDGYFTGLEVTLDENRLFQGLEISDDRKDMVVNFKSLSALEQIFIGKSQLYTQVYFHHKTRAAATIIHRLLLRLEEKNEEIRSGFGFNNPASYLLLDEHDLLGRKWNDADVERYIQKLRRRELPKRALVMSHSCLPDIRDESSLTDEEIDIAHNWGDLRRDLRDNLQFLIEEEQKILGRCPDLEGDVYLDFPGDPTVMAAAERPQIKMGRDDGEILNMNEIFPAEGWANATEFYKGRQFIFTDVPKSEIPEVTRGALEWLEVPHGIRVNPLAIHDAKLSTEEVSWERFLD